MSNIIKSIDKLKTFEKLNESYCITGWFSSTGLLESTGLITLSAQVLVLYFNTNLINIFFFHFKHPSFKIPDFQDYKTINLCYHLFADDSIGFAGIEATKSPRHITSQIQCALHLHLPLGCISRGKVGMLKWTEINFLSPNRIITYH